MKYDLTRDARAEYKRRDGMHIYIREEEEHRADRRPMEEEKKSRKMPRDKVRKTLSIKNSSPATIIPRPGPRTREKLRAAVVETQADACYKPENSFFCSRLGRAFQFFITRSFTNSGAALYNPL